MNKLGLVFYIAAIAQTTDATINKISESDLEAFVNHVLKCYNISGLSLAMVTKSQTIFTGGFGVKTFEKGDLVTSKTLFNVGSVSKSFTATIAADAVSRGKIEWDKPLKDTFGKDFKLSDSFRTERATLRDVLAHKMCVPEYWGATTIAENITRQEMIKRLPFYTTFCDLRTEYQYSNQMVVAGAAAVEIATCQYWEDAIFQKIYKPLGMNGSRIGSRMSDGDWANTAISYTNFNGKPVPNPEQQQSIMLDYMGPAAGVYSNAEDMAKYLRFHLNNGKDENGKQMIAEKELADTHKSNYAIQQTNKVTTDIFPVLSTIDAYGMGWRTGYYRGYRKVEHTGSFSGYTCRNTFLPDADVGVWLCEASSYDGYTANQLVSWYALDMLLGKQPWLNETTACTFPAPWVPPQPTQAPTTTTKVPTTFYPQPSCGVNLTHYIGDYNNRAFGTFHVYFNQNNDLVCSSGQLLNCTLTPLDCDHHFLLLVTGALTYRDPNRHGWKVHFERTQYNTSFQTVTMSYMDSEYPPVFHRGDSYKPVDYPAGRGPLSAICKKPKRRAVPSTRKPVSSASFASYSIYGFMTAIILCLL